MLKHLLCVCCCTFYSINETSSTCKLARQHKLVWFLPVHVFVYAWNITEMLQRMLSHAQSYRFTDCLSLPFDDLSY